MDKKQLRTYYKKLRGFLTEQEKEQKSLAIANHLLTLDIWDKTYFHLFLTIEELNEIDTEYILQILMGKDKEIVISKTIFEERKMIHFYLLKTLKSKKPLLIFLNQLMESKFLPTRLMWFLFRFWLLTKWEIALDTAKVFMIIF